MNKAKDGMIQRINHLAGLGVPRHVAEAITTDDHPTGRIEFKNMDSETPEILIYEMIGLDWFTGEGVSAKGFAEQLDSINADTIRVRINSPGGDVWDGITIYNLLATHGANIEVVVDGIAASAASIIAMAGDRVKIHESAQLMIHSAWTMAAGNSADFQELADTLKKIDGQLAAVYASKSGRPAEDFLAIMPKDNYLTAAESFEMGLVDEILTPPAKTPRASTESTVTSDSHVMRNGSRKRLIQLKKAKVTI